MPRNFELGALAQLIERGIRIAEVAGLIPARSTKYQFRKIPPGDFLYIEKFTQICYNY